MFRLNSFAARVVIEAVRPAPLCAEKVTFAWRLAVGPAVARVTTVRLDDAGVLHVLASDKHWYREVRRMRALIQSRLAATLGDGVVREISAIP